MEKFNFIIFRSSIKDKKIRENLSEQDAKTDRFILILIFVHAFAASTVFPILFSNFVLGFSAGLVISGISYFAYRFYKGTLVTKTVLPLALLLFTFIFIQQSYGRIETHFHFWIVLGILIAYLDVLPILGVSVLIAAHHVSLNFCQQTGLKIGNTDIVIFETGASWFTTFLHAGFVIPSTAVFSYMVSVNLKNFIKRQEHNAEFSDQSKNLQYVLANVMSSIGVISQTRRDLLDVAQRLASDAEKQSQVTQEVTNSISEILKAIEQNNSTIDKTNKITDTTVQHLHSSSEMFNQALEQVVKISQKINIVSDIAFQTNLLSLNASIQAAKAGKFGKSFEVVAEEVRILAEKSNTASFEISKLSKTTSQTAEKASIELGKIFKEIESTSDLVSEISKATEQQKHATDIVTNSSQLLSSLSMQNTTSAQKILTRIERLNEQVNLLMVAIQGIEVR